MNELTAWWFDSGEPRFLSAINEYTEPREPCWRGHYFGDPLDLVTWLHSNCKGKYDYTYRYNNGAPYLAIEIYDPDDSVAFKMRWA